MKFFKLLSTIMVLLSAAGYAREEETIDVTYEELKELNATCPPRDTCASSQPDDIPTSKECDCDTFCSRYGTCCVDSSYKHMPAPKIKPTCRRLGRLDLAYLVIDQCPQRENSQSVYKVLCEDEWDGQNDIMRLIPVTSLFTHITYKNFFCFRCHEANDDFLFWNVNFEYEQDEGNEEDTRVHLEYDGRNNTWMAQLGKGGRMVPVTFPTFTPVSDISSVPKTCKLDVISKCSEDWKDETMIAKCNAYLAMTVIQNENASKEYRNPHCALCNFENLDDFICRAKTVTFSVAQKTAFSFTNLLDINQSDGNKVGKIKKCEDNDIWDPNFEKCRSLKCVMPGYVLKDGKCIPP